MSRSQSTVHCADNNYYYCWILSRPFSNMADDAVIHACADLAEYAERLLSTFDLEDMVIERCSQRVMGTLAYLRDTIIANRQMR